MKKRNIWAVMGLSLITLGIYYLYWLYSTRQELVAKGQRVPPFWLLFFPVLLILLVAVMQFSIRFALPDTMSDVGAESPVEQLLNIISTLAGIFAVLSILPISVYWYYKYCKAVESVTGGQMSFGTAFGLGLLFNFVALGFIWPGLVQDAYNKVGTGAPYDPMLPSYQ